MGGQRVDVTLLVAAIVGLSPLLTAARRRSPEAMAMLTLIAAAGAVLLIARVSSLVAPTWASRYFAPAVAPLLLLAAYSTARARLVGAVAIVLAVAFLANPKSFVPQYKSDMRDVAGEIGPLLHSGDVVLVGQPEQTPLAWYYLPSHLRYVSTAGVVSDPSYMNWSGALQRLQRPQSPGDARGRWLLVSSPASSFSTCAR